MMKLGFIPSKFRQRIILGFSVLILLFLGVMIAVEMAGIPGMANKGKFATYRSHTLDNMELVSGLLDDRISSWFRERRIDVDGLTIAPLLRKTIESKTTKSSRELTGELNAFLTSNHDIGAVAILDSRNASILGASGGFFGACTASDIGINPDRFSRHIVPGYPETIDIHRAVDKKLYLRIIRQVLSTKIPDRIIAVIVAECDIERALRPFIESVGNSIFTHDWECIIAGNIEGVVTLFRKNGPVLNPGSRAIPKVESLSPISLAFSGMDGPYDGPDQNGRYVLAFHSQIKIDRGISLALILQMDRNLALRSAWVDLSRHCTLWFSMLIAGIVLCIFLAKQITRPVKELVSVAKRIEAGDLTARASATDQTEIGELALVFNGMVAGLQNWHEDLERQVLDRTRKLRNLTLRQNAILTAVSDIIMEANTNRTYTWSNNAGLEFFGADVIGRDYEYYFEGEQNTSEIIQSLYDGTENLLYVESRQRRKDGEVRLLAWWCKALEDEHGKITGTLSSARDVTETKRAEEMLRDKNAELERFAYTVSHDLKSPIITIRSFSGSIRSDLESGRHDRIDMDLLRIDTAADKMAALLSDLLELSRIGRIINTPEQTDMAELVNNVLMHLSGPLQKRGVRVSVQAGLSMAICDRQRIDGVLQNLVENAIKYMGDQSDPQIVVGMRSNCGENIFFVQDNGIGIDIKFQPTVFGLFNKLNPNSEGTGIGLALVKRIVEVHGGRTWVESEGLGKGSRFCFTLPE